MLISSTSTPLSSLCCSLNPVIEIYFIPYNLSCYLAMQERSLLVSTLKSIVTAFTQEMFATEGSSAPIEVLSHPQSPAFDNDYNKMLRCHFSNIME